MKRKTRVIISGLLILALVSLACNISIPDSSAIDAAATSVAGTVNALAGTAEALVTELPHDIVTTETPGEELPTLPPAAVVYPMRVSFVTPDGNLYTWTEGMASPILLASDGDICCSYVSPDGSLIAFTRFGADYAFISLEVINADGSNRHTLLDATAMAALPRPAGAIGSETGQVVWVPNSHTLAMNTRLLFEGPGLAFNPTLYLINAESGVMNPLMDVGSESWKFFYSPDGSKIAVTLPTQISMYAADGSLIADSILSYDFVNTASEYAWVASPVWSADSLELVVGVPPANPWDEVPGDSYVYRVSYDGLSGEALFQGQMSTMAGGSVAFSPDLSKFLYFTQFGARADNTDTLNIGYIDGSPGSAYTNDSFMYDPVWSPDNTHFFYTTGTGNTQYPFIGQVGAGPSAVSDYTNAAQIKWIDDDRYITVSNNGGVSRLLLGTIGASTGLIYDHGSPASNFLTFSVNR